LVTVGWWPPSRAPLQPLASRQLLRAADASSFCGSCTTWRAVPDASDGGPSYGFLKWIALPSKSALTTDLEACVCTDGVWHNSNMQ
jgi:hypothetical protein